MTTFKDFDESKVADYSIDELTMFLNEIEMRRSVLSENCASEMGEYLQDDKFDPYSFRGSRKIKKIAEKYANLFDVANDYFRLINKELEKKLKFEEEARYSGRGIKKPIKNESEEEFLQREQDKTDVYRSKLD